MFLELFGGATAMPDCRQLLHVVQCPRHLPRAERTPAPALNIGRLRSPGMAFCTSPLQMSTSI
jgi:hypothetical protein